MVFWVAGRIKQRTLVPGDHVGTVTTIETRLSKGGGFERERASEGSGRTKGTNERALSKTGCLQGRERRAEGKEGGEGRNEGHTPVGINRRDERRGGPTLFPVPAPTVRCCDGGHLCPSSASRPPHHPFRPFLFLTSVTVLRSSSPPIVPARQTPDRTLLFFLPPCASANAFLRRGGPGRLCAMWEI